MKYKIIECTDANGNKFYRAKYKRFLFWHYIRYKTRTKAYKLNIVEKSSYQSMKDYIGRYIADINRERIVSKNVVFKGVL